MGGEREERGRKRAQHAREHTSTQQGTTRHKQHKGGRRNTKRGILRSSMGAVRIFFRGGSGSTHTIIGRPLYNKVTGDSRLGADVGFRIRIRALEADTTYLSYLSYSSYSSYLSFFLALLCLRGVCVCLSVPPPLACCAPPSLSPLSLPSFPPSTSAHCRALLKCFLHLRWE